MAHGSGHNGDGQDPPAPPGLPPPPPPHTIEIPARLSLDHHRDANGAFDLSSVLSIVRGFDSRDGPGNESGGSSHSYEMVSPHDDRDEYFATTTTGTVSSNSGEQQRSSPLAVVNHGRYNDGSGLDGGVDRSWEDVSATLAAAGGAGAQLYGDHHHHHHHHHHRHPADGEGDIHYAPREHDRPYSSVGDIFKDFDGVHYYPDHSGQLPPPTAHSQPEHRNYADQRRGSRPISYAPPLDNTAPSESSRDSGFVYYPAPVPAVLNLPPLMAKDTKARNRLTKVQKRASQQVLSDATAPLEHNNGTSNNRRSMHSDAWAATPGNNQQHRLSNLPPALRASVFFDSTQPAPQIMPGELRDSSAVATLDSILDASANAPAAAFTDHPITGTDATQHLPPPRNGYRNSVAMTVTLHPGESPPPSEGGPTPEMRHSRSFEVPPSAEGALPTTLLAELESRKQQQKSRNRTAASAFPSGIRSTLLELDAVAQVQAQSRRQKRTTLAWEDPDDANNDDEDVPLGLLYQGGTAARPGRPGGKDEDVPLGLLMQKQMEESEPLSKRRERLRGAQGASTPAPTLPAPKIPPVGGPEEEEEEETLAARMKRLKEEKEKASINSGSKRQSTFGDGGLDINFDAPSPSAAPPPQPEEETLAQRRKRLQGEEERRRLTAEAKVVQAELRKRHSLTLLQQQQMLGSGPLGRSTPMLQRPMSGMAQRPMSGLIHQAGVPHMLRPQMSMGNMHQMGGPGMMMNGGMMMGGGSMGMGGMNAGMMMGMPPPTQMQQQNQMLSPQEIAMNNRQREMVERWRASVM